MLALEITTTPYLVDFSLFLIIQQCQYLGLRFSFVRPQGGTLSPPLYVCGSLPASPLIPPRGPNSGSRPLAMIGPPSYDRRGAPRGQRSDHCSHNPLVLIKSLHSHYKSYFNNFYSQHSHMMLAFMQNLLQCTCT